MSQELVEAITDMREDALKLTRQKLKMFTPI
jgi:hypothetical protein